MAKREGEGGATGKGVGGEGAGPPPRVEKMVDIGTREKRADSGVANPALCESPPTLGACDWLRMAMVAVVASTEVR